MKRSTLPNKTALSYSDIRFYEPVSRMHTTQAAFEETRGNRE